jgi:outer membrane immunogenic protein
MIRGARIESAEQICGAHGAVMRRLLVAVALIAMMSDASAGDFDLPILRGSEPVAPIGPVPPMGPVVSRWAGFFAGGQVGMSLASVDFSSATQSLVAHELRELALENDNHPSRWQVLGKGDTRSVAIGGFVGYNNPWECMIIGVDFNFSRINSFVDAPVSPITRVAAPSNGLLYQTTINGAASMRILDYGVLRVRAGVDLGNVLPYAGIGAAVGRADVFRTATSSGLEIDPSGQTQPTPFSFTETEIKSGALIYGWSLSGGVDVMIMPNVFMRAEYEFVNFVPIYDIKASVSTGRLGLGFKF